MLIHTATLAISKGHIQYVFIHTATLAISKGHIRLSIQWNHLCNMDTLGPTNSVLIIKVS